MINRLPFCKVLMGLVFFDNLPHGGGNVSKSRVNWKDSVGKKIKFIERDITGEIEIIHYDKAILTLKYKDNIAKMSTAQLNGGHIGALIGTFTKEHKYMKGDILNLKTGDIEILEQIRLCSQSNRKGYKYLCLKCGDIDYVAENDLLSSSCGCKVCGQYISKIVVGKNDLWATNPEVAKYLKYRDRGYEITKAVRDKETFICPDCGNDVNKNVYSVISQGFKCNKCGDGISMSEKMMSNVLSQLNIKFETQKTFPWSKNVIHDNKKICGLKIYDFYIQNVNSGNESAIIETHGKQHYENGFKAFLGNRNSRTLNEEQLNDKLKKDLALKNGIVHYIEIDCRETNLLFIKDNIINSDLSKLYDLANIDWSETFAFACGNLVKKACDLWNSGIKSAPEISRKLNIHHCTAVDYLHRGRLIGWCDYDAKRNQMSNALKMGKKNSRSVICLNTKEIFKSLTEAKNKYNARDISSCCKNMLLYSGKLDSETYLQWQYYDEYIKTPKPILSKNDISSMRKINVNSKRVICVTTGDIYNTSFEAEKATGIKNIRKCCLGERNYAGLHKDTNEKLQWMYYSDYLNGKKLNVIKKVICIETKCIYNSISDAKKETKLSRIKDVCEGKPRYNTAGGYHWMYYDDYLKLHNETSEAKLA